MFASQNMLPFIIIGVVLNGVLIFAQNQAIDCQRPPRLIDPAFCCRDGGRDQTTEKCAQQVRGNGQSNGAPPSMEVATCLAECILTNSQYIEEPQKLNLINIRNDLSTKFSNDSAYVEAMASSYAKCAPQAAQRLAAMQQFQMTTAQNTQRQQQSKCSPFAAIVLGCTYMEYFKNCPADRWTESADCALAKNFVTQCSLGA